MDDEWSDSDHLLRYAKVEKVRNRDYQSQSFQGVRWVFQSEYSNVLARIANLTPEETYNRKISLITKILSLFNQK